MPDLLIRPSRARDAAAIGAVFQRSYGQLLTPDYPEPLLEKVLPVIARPRPDLLGAPGYLVAVSGGRIVAAGGWSRASPQSGGEGSPVGHIRHLACDPDFLRRGIARALMLAALDQACGAGMRLICCLSTRTAVPFYRGLGFEGDAEVDLRLRPGLYFPAVEMRKRIA